ncbi:hypothetical protein BWQ96_00496 [Gracilariopsis chorda]|uniref:Uncharacterized protein n=1 Tax=Gracilariopsis chorda TaxID=448386 RepID=A0A2V3J5B1_9FLOR|nr:hypothetical protein BWQ96_00496 [Gracilariopsis chorda]|eukprot:PXF49618.1 hypothetical protein BWQ96_00496 [Gracilariopsis chorda]
MKQKDYQIGAAIRRKQKRSRITSLALLAGAKDEVLLRLQKRYRRVARDVRLIQRRSRHISVTSFNVNFFSDEQCLWNFRFRKQDLGAIIALTGWNSRRTKRSGYVCDPVAAT